jgi:DNA-binding MarR family transcriptional regulator
MREGCPDDRRGTFAVLTDEGWATIQRVAPVHVSGVREHFVDRLTDDQLEELVDAYDPIVEHLKKLR